MVAYLMNRSEEATEEPYAERLKSSVDDMVEAIETLEHVRSTPINLTATDIRTDKYLSEPMEIDGMASRITAVKKVFSDFEVEEKEYRGKITDKAQVKLVFEHEDMDDLYVNVRLFFAGSIVAEPEIQGSKVVRRGDE
jgi:hypothetical protein